MPAGLMIIMFFLLTIAGCQQVSCPKTYTVNFLPKAHVTLDGQITDAAWQKTQHLTDFCLPWEDSKLPYTEFRAFYDRQSFYFLFSVTDADIVTFGKSGDELLIDKDDRVEIFLSCDSKLKKYYGIEINSVGRIMDYSAAYHRNFDFFWGLAGIKTASLVTDNGYNVEASIPIKSLESLGLLDMPLDNMIYAGIFRADVSQTKISKLKYQWLSWVNPKTVEEDFHIPQTFGCLVFEKSP